MSGYTIPQFTNTVFAGIYIACSLIGIPCNIISLMYFLSTAPKSSHVANKAFFNIIYIITAMVDVLVCATLLPVIISFMRHRDPAWFVYPTFCLLWGIVWEMLPFMSVFLVGIMSISRTLVLIKPLYQLKRWGLYTALGSYFIFLVGRTVVPLSLNDATYEYVYSDVYCYELPTADWSYKFNSISRLLTLAAPVVPICISCIISYTIIILNERRQASLRRGSQVSKSKEGEEHTRQQKFPQKVYATKTIVIFTVAYIVFNIPVFINYILMSIAGYNPNCVSDCFTKTYEDHPALIWYSWNFTYIMCVALNSTINPLIYYWRMQPIQTYVNSKARRTSDYIQSFRHQSRNNSCTRVWAFRSNKVGNGGDGKEPQCFDNSKTIRESPIEVAVYENSV